MADSKVTALTENTTPLGTDLLYIIDDPGSTPASQKITVANLLFKDAEGDPAAVSNTAAADGTSTFAARRDHAHLRSAFVGARYNSNSAQNVVNNTTIAIINFEDQVYDTGTLVTTGASWKFTAPTTGYYHVDCFVMFAAAASWAAGERGLLQLFKNNSLSDTLDWRDCQPSNTIMSLRGSITIGLNATDYIDVRIAQNSGSDIALSNVASSVWVNIERVG